MAPMKFNLRSTKSLMTTTTPSRDEQKDFRSCASEKNNSGELQCNEQQKHGQQDFKQRLRYLSKPIKFPSKCLQNNAHKTVQETDSSEDEDRLKLFDAKVKNKEALLSLLNSNMYNNILKNMASKSVIKSNSNSGSDEIGLAGERRAIRHTSKPCQPSSSAYTKSSHKSTSSTLRGTASEEEVASSKAACYKAQQDVDALRDKYVSNHLINCLTNSDKTLKTTLPNKSGLGKEYSATDSFLSSPENSSVNDKQEISNALQKLESLNQKQFASQQQQQQQQHSANVQQMHSIQQYPKRQNNIQQQNANQGTRRQAQSPAVTIVGQPSMSSVQMSTTADDPYYPNNKTTTSTPTSTTQLGSLQSSDYQLQHQYYQQQQQQYSNNMATFYPYYSQQQLPYYHPQQQQHYSQQQQQQYQYYQQQQHDWSESVVETDTTKCKPVTFIDNNIVTATSTTVGISSTATTSTASNAGCILSSGANRDDQHVSTTPIVVNTNACAGGRSGSDGRSHLTAGIVTANPSIAVLATSAVISDIPENTAYDTSGHITTASRDDGSSTRFDNTVNSNLLEKDNFLLGGGRRASASIPSTPFIPLTPASSTPAMTLAPSTTTRSPSSNSTSPVLMQL